MEAEAKKNNIPIYKVPKLKMTVATLIIDFVSQNAPKQKAAAGNGTPQRKTGPASKVASKGTPVKSMASNQEPTSMK